jgi:hypothetical protein
MDRGRVLLALGAATLMSTGAAFAGSGAPAGSVHQVSGKNGCYTSDGSSEAGPGTCHNIRGGVESTTLAISPDGRFAYLVGYGDSESNVPPPVLSVFRRNDKDGTLKQLPGKSGCFSRDGSSEDGANTCARARDLDTGDATSIVISRDGRFLYVASQYTQNGNDIGGIAVFKRNLTTGTLRQLRGKAGCVVAVSYKRCAVAREVDSTSSLHITPDQKYLYASNYDVPPHSGIAIFTRNAKSGALRQLSGSNGCVTDDGTTVQSVTKEICRAMPNLSEPWDVATPDNRFAYIPAAYNHIDLVQGFKRNAEGGLAPLKGKGACVSDHGTSPAGACVKGHGLSNPERALLSKNGRFLYIGSYVPPSPIVVLDRNPRTGLLSERRGPAACISLNGRTGDGVGSCRNGRAINGEYAGAITPDGRTLYFSEFTSDALTIFRLSPMTGAFHQLPAKFGCVTPDGSSEGGSDTCGMGRSISGAYQVALGSHGRDVYVSAGANTTGKGVALFHAAP